MKNEIEAVITELGIISGRDAIFVDQLCESFSPHNLVFTGEFNSTLCSKSSSREKFIKYQITFEQVIMYECHEIDYCKYENELLSSFDRVNPSAWFKDFDIPSEYSHYRFATYDYLYQIIAKGYELVL